MTPHEFPRRDNYGALRIVPIGFATLILLGALLLWLAPTRTAGTSISFLDSLFLSTSATCVTGLTTVNVANDFNIFGQAVILFLIQAGGLGIYTGTLLLAIFSRSGLSLEDEQIIRATLGRLREARPPSIFLHACGFILLCEFAGGALLYFLMHQAAPDRAIGQTIWEAAFHSVSAFCNAGISIYREGLVRWRNNPLVLLVVSGQVILGGIGLMTMINLRYVKFWKRDARKRGHLALQTKLAVTSTLILLIIGTLGIWLFEQHHTLAGEPLVNQLTWSFFHSAMTRTAGFNVVDNGAMSEPTLLLSTILMFIGGCPGSMAGGIKTVTFAVLILTVWQALRRREVLHVFNRSIPSHTKAVAVMITFIAASTLVIGIGGLLYSELGGPATRGALHELGLVYEAVSAFGTVGLSTGVTPLLSSVGKSIIIVLMFVGRVGPLVLSVYLSWPPRQAHVRYPAEELSLG